MIIAEILGPERVSLEVEASSKKRALEMLSALISQAKPSLSSRAVCDCLVARERLGSTGLGDGVALPHARMGDLKEAIGAFVRTRSSIDFDAQDGQPVDLLFGLLVPRESTEEHLEILAQLATMFSNESFRRTLRTCTSPDEVYELLCQRTTQA